MGTSTPRSCTLKPLAESMVATSDFPISWISPFDRANDNHARGFDGLLALTQLWLQQVHRLRMPSAAMIKSGRKYSPQETSHRLCSCRASILRG